MSFVSLTCKVQDLVDFNEVSTEEKLPLVTVLLCIYYRSRSCIYLLLNLISSSSLPFIIIITFMRLYTRAFLHTTISSSYISTNMFIHYYFVYKSYFLCVIITMIESLFTNWLDSVLCTNRVQQLSHADLICLFLFCLYPTSCSNILINKKRKCFNH